MTYTHFDVIFLNPFYKALRASIRRYVNKLIYSLRVNTDIAIQIDLEGFCEIMYILTNENKKNNQD